MDSPFLYIILVLTNGHLHWQNKRNKYFYADDNSPADLTAIIPYQEVIFKYTIAASSVSYTFNVNTTRQISSSGSIINNPPVVVTEKITFSSEEFGTAAISVSGLGTLTSNINVVHGERPNVTGVKISRSNGTPADSILDVGDSEYLKAEVIPDTAGNKNVTWTSDNEETAAVSSSGRVEAKRPGSAAATVTT